MPEKTEIPRIIPDVLEKIFFYIPSPQIMQWRCVSKEWNEVIKKLIKKRNDFSINLDGNIPRCEKLLAFLQHPNPSGFLPSSLQFKSLPNKIPEGDLQKLLRIYENICNILGSSGSIMELKIVAVNQTISNKDYLNLLQKFANSLQKLQIPYPIPSPQIKQANSTTSEFSKLTHLELPHYSTPEFSQFLSCILSISPNVTHISGYEQGDLIPLLKNSHILQQLQKIELSNPNPEDLDLLLSENQDLNDFTIADVNFLGINETLERFLDKQKDKLKSLAFINVMGMPTLNFPSFLNLTSLEFALPAEDRDDLDFLVNVNFAKDTPNLKKFTVGEMDRQIRDWRKFLSFDGNRDLNPCVSLEELTLDLAMNDPECCTFLGRIFPKVKKLVLTFPSEDFLLRVWSSWKEIVVLEINCCWVDGDSLDRDLFGIKDSWKNGVDMKEEKWWEKASQPEIEGETLANFKKLQRLTVGGMAPPLSDFSVYFGLVKLQDLRKLTVKMRSEITKEGVAFLKEKLPLLNQIYTPTK